MYILLQSETTLFLGRFHSLLVHLPIGFLLLAAILFLLSFSKRFRFLLNALPLTLFLGALSAMVSVILGFFLAEEGGYPSDNLFWHRIMGIAVSVLSVGAVLLMLGFFKKSEKGLPFTSRLKIDRMERAILERKSSFGILMGAIVISVSITGHLGGGLTHGENYLYTYAPEFVQDLFLSANHEQDSLAFPADSDSTLLFEHILGPTIQQKCANCHNAESPKGGLNVTSLDDLIRGGDSGPAFESGAPESSELFVRVTLDPKSRKYMPPKGAGLSYGEIMLLNFWIENGMSPELAITDESIPEEIQAFLENTYGLSTRRKAHYEKFQVAQLSEEDLRKLQEQGFRVSTLSGGNNFLDVVGNGKLAKENIQVLDLAKEQITWLDLGGSGAEDSWLEIIGGFPNLTRLMLDNNEITDKGTSHLSQLENLESVNLYNTSVGDSTLVLLSQMKSLKRVYLWNTKVTSELVNRIKEENPSLDIDNGMILEKKEEKD
ncbi:c-type cytochrome domain-containing protein [Algoriphagus limi]|uniref:Cytochrome c domain-containing protein n=1 Tax=Algoriphagus limi TaxID=2975273 RepID=A0ABT2G975_9BACT|nr:c-type cytochrome domain-containing protein [Algoriphagus limi]MCS5490555.1 hypothetical protein [Algoriphagus limi]